jgi:hypothetical protein
MNHEIRINGILSIQPDNPALYLDRPVRAAHSWRRSAGNSLRGVRTLKAAQMRCWPNAENRSVHPPVSASASGGNADMATVFSILVWRHQRFMINA